MLTFQDFTDAGWTLLYDKGQNNGSMYFRNPIGVIGDMEDSVGLILYDLSESSFVIRVSQLLDEGYDPRPGDSLFEGTTEELKEYLSQI